MLKRRFYFLFLLLVPLSSSGVFAQYYLVLKNRTKIKYVFAAGDELKFKLHGEDFYNEQMIKGFGAEKIRFHYFDLALSEVSHIKVSELRKNGLTLLSRLAITGGVLFMVADQFNQLAIMNEALGPSDETLVITGTLIGTGLLLKLFQKRKFKIDGRKYRLETTDFVPARAF